ncbi:spermidine synthase [Knoellia sp. CPCC 206453]|uniref:spermidine synthase n=1 Tax=Knoellia pratensis TaxID=3404796 RepID=UPI003611141A
MTDNTVPPSVPVLDPPREGPSAREREGSPVDPAPASVRAPGIVALFTVTAFVGASLLFVVQPLIARILLPAYGGSATVWSTSSLFFQVLLLLGYLYSHVTTRRFGPRWQPPVHLLALLAPVVALPVALPLEAVPGVETSPVLWLLRTLTLMIGLPFVVISTSGPLLQRWYSWSGGPRAEDPYFLFAASNVGSFVGLLAYPFVIEPLLTVDQQRVAWSVGFALFALLTATCGIVTRSKARAALGESPRVAESDPDPATSVTSEPSATERGQVGITRRDLLTWLVISFLPSALMLAVTSHISTDVAAIPLLWVIPLALYLATFIVAFARIGRTAPRLSRRLAVVAAVVALALIPQEAGGLPLWLIVPVLMAMLTLVSYAAHAQLAADRPDVEHLTAFYLVVATGGALGGLLNGVIAPLVFDRVWEYWILLALVPVLLLRRAGAPSRIGRYADRNWAAFAIVCMCGTIFVFASALTAATFAGTGAALATVVVVAGGAWWLSARRGLAAVPVLVILLAFAVLQGQGTIDQRRTFYGSYRVVSTDGQHQLMHGTTLHGLQWQDDRRYEPTTYYAKSGSLGSVFAQPALNDVAVVGLGVGTIAAYGKPGQRFTFVEIDPAVVDIARDPRLFTYLADAKADVDVQVGDGRLALEAMPDASKDLIILDAFSSDSIPVHLLTVDAMRSYASKLRPDGLLMVHISNRVFDLQPVLRGAADDLGWDAAFGTKAEGVRSTVGEWVALSPRDGRVAEMRRSTAWGPLTTDSTTWTDDYSSVLSVLR